MLTAPDSNPILCSVTLVRARLANVARVGIGLQINIQNTSHDVSSPPKLGGLEAESVQKYVGGREVLRVSGMQVKYSDTLTHIYFFSPHWSLMLEVEVML